MSDKIAVSIIVPVYNLAEKLSACFASLDELTAFVETEVIFIDDCSTDGSRDLLVEECERRQSWRLIESAVNSGSPSRPRNIGIEHATKPWLFFLDGDDAINAEELREALILGSKVRAQTVRAPVLVDQVEQEPFLVGRLPVESRREELVSAESIARYQSLTASALYCRETLRSTGIRFDPTSRMGEDLAFTARFITRCDRIAYYDRPLFRYIKRNWGAASAMRKISDRDLSELAKNWQLAEDAFAGRGSSYLELHGLDTISFALRQLIRYGANEIDPRFFQELSVFFRTNKDKIESMKFERRLEAMVDALLRGDHSTFEFEARPRLLIAGHDLKFIKGAELALTPHFSIQFDEWPSERSHDVATSEALLDWADLVWCEWLAAAAVWYSRRIHGNKRLIIREHRYELARDYGFSIDRDRVDAIITIAPHMYEDTLERFQYPRSKVRYIPNFYDSVAYDRGIKDDVARRFRVGIIGITPRRKGYMRALRLLQLLRKWDSRYSLTVMGNDPMSYGWVSSDPAERAYFSACERFAEDNLLSDAVTYSGWVDTHSFLSGIGTVVSLSDGEGCHIGPGEALFAGGCAQVLNWRGADFVYPGSVVHDSVEDMAIAINADPPDLGARDGAEQHFKSTFGMDAFVKRVVDLWCEIAQ